MARTGAVRVAITGDASGLSRATVRAQHDVARFSDRGSKSLNALKVAAAGVGVALATGFIAGSKVSIKAAVDLGEEINKTRVVFRGSEKDILRWSKNTATALGISRREALQSAGVFGNMLVPMGFARKEAGRMSTGLVKLAADMASFNNASPQEVLEGLRAGLAGETEPLRRFGVFLNDARLKQEALNLHLKNAIGPNGALTANAKAQATYSLILKDTKDAQGDFARTSGSLANQQRILKAQFENISAEIGAKLLPYVVKAANAVSRFITQMQRGKGAGGAFAESMRDLGKSIAGVARVTAAAWRAMGNVMFPIGDKFLGMLSSMLRGMLVFVRAATKIPGVGDRFKGLARDIDSAADNIDGLREEIRRLHGKDIEVGVQINLKGSGAPSNPFGDGWGVESQIKSMVKGQVKSGKLDLFGLGAVGPLGMGGAGRVDAFNDDAARFGLSITSGFRPGSITSSGNLSFHALNRARDYADGAPSMLSFARYMAATYGGNLTELIHSPLGFSIKNGQRVAPYAVADHYDHVHVALQRGGMIPGVGSGDKVPVMAEPGEGFINKRATAALGGKAGIDAINAMVPRFQGGGVAQMAGGGPSVGAEVELASIEQKLKRIERGGVSMREWRGYRRLYRRYSRLWRLSHGTDKTMRPFGVRPRPTQWGGFIERFQKGGMIGNFSATSYGPPWGGIQGTGTTATGINLKGSPHRHIIAVDPSRVSLGSKVWAWPNPFGYRGPFLAGDTGGAIKGNRIDFYDWRGRQKQLGWGQRDVTLFRSDPWKGGGGPTKITGRPITDRGRTPAQRARDAADRAHDRAGAPVTIGDVLGGRNRSLFRGGGTRTFGVGIDEAFGKGAVTGGGGGGGDALTDALNRLADLEEQRIDIDREVIVGQKRQEYLITRQGPQLVAWLTAALSGNIGRTAGLARRTPAAAGRVAAS